MPSQIVVAKLVSKKSTNFFSSNSFPARLALWCTALVLKGGIREFLYAVVRMEERRQNSTQSRVFESASTDHR